MHTHVSPACRGLYSIHIQFALDNLDLLTSGLLHADNLPWTYLQ